MNSAALRLAMRVYRALLIAYPEPFRSECGAEMRRTFEEMQEADADRGVCRLARLFARTVADLLSSASRERSETMVRSGWVLPVGVVVGLGVAWIDSRPRWDDTGITAGILFLACAALGAADPRGAWKCALAVGIWIPLYNILTSGNYGAIPALLIALIGAYAGAGLRFLGFPPPSEG